MPFLLCTTAEPEALRIELSRVMGAIRQPRAGITARADEPGDIAGGPARQARRHAGKRTADPGGVRP